MSTPSVLVKSAQGGASASVGAALADLGKPLERLLYGLAVLMLVLYPVVLILAALVFTSITLFYSFRGFGLIVKGRNTEAIRCLAAYFGHDIPFQLRSTANQCRLNLAVAYHRLGEFHSSMGELARIDVSKADKIVRSVWYSIRAANIALSGGNAEEAIAAQEAAENHLPPDLTAAQGAFIRTLVDDRCGVDTCIRRSQQAKTNRKVLFGFKTVLWVDKQLSEIENNYFLGRCYYFLGDFEKAKEHFGRNRESRFGESFYVRDSLKWFDMTENPSDGQ